MERVAITTAGKGADRLGQVAKRYGLVPVLLPCIAVVPASAGVLDRARSLAAEADLVVVTSSRAITTLWPRGGIPPVPVAAVGASTAAAVEQAGGGVEVAGEAGAHDLALELAERVGGRSVFFPHASGADPSTAEALKEAGAEVRAVAVYETTPVGPAADPVDAVVFGSPSAVAGWLLTRDFEDIVVAAIGQTTAAALIEAGREPEVVAPRPDFEDLIARLGEYMRVRSPA